MSKSDTDSDLDFESADEGQNDLSDLSDLDEILNEDSNKKEATTVLRSETNTKSELKPEKVHTNQKNNSTADRIKDEAAVETSHKAEDFPQPVKKDTGSIESRDLENEKVESSKLKIPVKNEVKTKQQEPTLRQSNNVTPPSVEIDRDLSEPSSKSNAVEITKNFDKLNFKSDNTEKTNNVTETKTNVAPSGWDNNWDDLDDDQDEEPAELKPVNKEKPKIPTSQSEPHIQSKAEIKRVDTADDNLKNIDQVFERLANQPKQQSSGGGWNWTKLGSNLLSSAVNLTSQVLETVETTLGAPDPAELAAQIAKTRSEDQLEEPEAKKEELKKEEKDVKTTITSDWDNDDQEWFSLPKLANTVVFFL
jgi:hypothetical protein